MLRILRSRGFGCTLGKGYKEPFFLASIILEVMAFFVAIQSQTRKRKRFLIVGYPPNGNIKKYIFPSKLGICIFLYFRLALNSNTS